ncbi:hypothetical protein KAFR_0B05280 [Kazachstania africana CBS 2517]|uniref:MADS-box domain-containing protein n=1 Tax=Kazachstania africana (strain ATCC 22294 / BCRC 22015 / CBS 2517 / CECT 1963 / NBRC 1671 / NRRL Y-8276) TaxID=1071382 RepID=H2AR23_KAZAF|nr:hypothetical protein KAFR_0B05280 [Kazachstania africana CBS 2517]CCF56823.1 hypothetical protein KAFR_0B05280 [Kazachstania africana CBS 2517]
MSDKEENNGNTSQDKVNIIKERKKIDIKYIENKTRRHVTFSKRKHGIMKKAFELSVLTGTQVLLLVVSETGLVYTFSTPKFEPIVTQPEGRNLIQACLSAPDQLSDDDEKDGSNLNKSNFSDSSNLFGKNEDVKMNIRPNVSSNLTIQQPAQPQRQQYNAQNEQNMAQTGMIPQRQETYTSSNPYVANAFYPNYYPDVSENQY